MKNGQINSVQIYKHEVLFHSKWQVLLWLYILNLWLHFFHKMTCFLHFSCVKTTSYGLLLAFIQSFETSLRCISHVTDSTEIIMPFELSLDGEIQIYTVMTVNYTNSVTEQKHVQDHVVLSNNEKSNLISRMKRTIQALMKCCCVHQVKHLLDKLGWFHCMCGTYSLSVWKKEPPAISRAPTMGGI